MDHVIHQQLQISKAPWLHQLPRHNQCTGDGDICLQQQQSLGVSWITLYNQGLVGPAMAPPGKKLCLPALHLVA